ncbi:hypothetical protein PtB15_5B651 [Puccinia triticina]|nr:hypothetical protein PtB15_5B651 [Puccinia triticina]
MTQRDPPKNQAASSSHEPGLARGSCPWFWDKGSRHPHVTSVTSVKYTSRVLGFSTGGLTIVRIAPGVNQSG